MRFIIDILHPAHVHFFRNFIREMKSRGHEFLVTAREKECAVDLLRLHDIPHTVISRQRKGIASLALEFVARNWKFRSICKEFRPDYLTGIMGPTIACVGRLVGSKAVIFYDTEMAKITNWFAYPLAHRVCTPRCYEGEIGPQQVRYDGYHELAYLHPGRYQPDAGILKELGVEPGQRVFLLRFVSWQASHDIGEKGFTLAVKRAVAEKLARRGRLFISSEGPLPEDLEKYRFRLPVHRMHDLLAHCDLLVGESATMASEAAVLGVPAMFVSKSSRGYTNDQEKRYGLVHNFTDVQQAEAMARLDQLLEDTQLAEKSRRAREKLLAEHVDVTAWMVQYFEGRP